MPVGGFNCLQQRLSNHPLNDTPGLIFIFIIVLRAVPVVNAQSSGDEFSNNLFADLAPLLSLFGEQVVKQYLSQSTEWLEHVIFACGPLGIITAVVSAIRVAGDSNLMAIIGRARESRAESEMELMSSTSSEVCELWNGLGIVRVNGSPDIIELIYDPNYISPAYLTTGQDNFGIYTLDDMEKIPNKGSGRLLGSLLALFMKTPASAEIPLYASSSSNRAAPNISLNITGRRISRRELVCIAWVAVILQIGLIIFEGFITYSLRWRKGTQNVAGYGFPLTAAGTLLISAGLFTCAYVVEASTEETEYDISSDGRKLQVMWLQRAQNVSDQEFGSYAIYAAKYQQRIMTSRLSTNNRMGLARLTGVGVICTITGFVVQFIGLRAMHYSASLGNLLLAAILTVIRTILRRGLTQKPDNQPIPSQNSYSVRKIDEGHELDFIVKDIMTCSYWNVATHIEPTHEPQQLVSRGIQTWQAKMKLSELAGLQWEGGLQSTIDNLAETIQAISNHLWSPLGVITVSRSARLKCLDWHVLVDTGIRGGISRVKIGMSLAREDTDARGSWVVKREEIAATVCLWLSSLSHVENSERAKNHWLLSSSDGNADIGRVLADWWISREKQRVEVPSNYSTLHRIGAGSHRDLDCAFPTHFQAPDISAAFPETSTETKPAFITQTSLLQMCTQYLISTFVSFAVCHIDRITSHTEIRKVDDQRLLVITNDSVRGLAETVQRSGLASMEESYRIVVPALSRARKLPNVAGRILKLLEREGRDGLLKEEQDSKRRKQAEFHRLVQSVCTDEINTLILQKRWVEAGDISKELQKTFSRKLGPTHFRTVDVENKIDDLCQKIISTDTRIAYASATGPSAVDTHTSTLKKAIRSGRASDVYDAIRAGNMNLISITDGGQTPLHLAASVGRAPIIKLLLYCGADPNTVDLAESRIALHFAISGTNGRDINERAEVVEILLKNGSNIDASDKKGDTSLILAAENGLENLVVQLIENGANLESRNENGDSAVLLAAKGGYEGIVRLLVKNKVDLNTANKDGHTALYSGARIVHEGIVKALVDGGASMGVALAAEEGFEVVLKLLIAGAGSVSRGDLDAAVILAAEKGHRNVVELLLEKGASADSRNQQNNNPLILAAENGYEDVVEFLLERGVDVNVVGENNKTALLAAGGKSENSKVVEVLLRFGADPNSKDSSCNTALHGAALAGCVRTVELLVEYGADVNTKADDSSTPLHCAANSGEERVARVLFRKHPDANVQNEFGDTALLIAVQGSHLAMVEFLLQNGADVNIPNNDNWTAIRWAVHLENEEMKMLLLENSAVLDP